MSVWDIVLSVVATVVTFGSTYWLARLAGRRYRTMKPWVAALTFVPGVLVGVVVCTFGALYRSTPLWVGGLGLMAGNLVGVRHGRTQADEARRKALRAEQQAAVRAAEDEPSGSEGAGATAP